MTSDDQQPELEDILRRRLAAAFPPAPSVAGWAERAADRARRRTARRRQALAVVSASCMAAAIAIGAASLGGNSNGDNPLPDTDREPAIAATPQPPQGMRYVGINSAIVTVPNDWDLRIGGCYDLTDENAVVVPSYSWPTCARAGPRPPVSLLRILPTDDANAPGLLEDARPRGKINGIAVLRTPTKSFADEWWDAALVVPAAKAIFWLEAPSSEAIDRVFDTLTRTPDGYVALPSTQAPWPCVRSRLQAAGMTVKIQQDAGSGLAPGNIIRSKPALGTVAERRTIVTLTVPTGGPDKCLPLPTSPGH